MNKYTFHAEFIAVFILIAAVTSHTSCIVTPGQVCYHKGGYTHQLKAFHEERSCTPGMG